MTSLPDQFLQKTQFYSTYVHNRHTYDIKVNILLSQEYEFKNISVYFEGVNAKTAGLKSSIHHGNTYPPKRSSVESSSCLNLTNASGASLSRLRSMPQDAIKKQTLSARGLSDKEFTKHCRGFEGQIKVSYFFFVVKVSKYHRYLVREIQHQQHKSTADHLPSNITNFGASISFFF